MLKLFGRHHMFFSLPHLNVLTVKNIRSRVMRSSGILCVWSGRGPTTHATQEGTQGWSVLMEGEFVWGGGF